MIETCDSCHQNELPYKMLTRKKSQSEFLIIQNKKIKK
jgi:hypothetical protein